MGFARTLDFRRLAGDDVALAHHLKEDHEPPIHEVFIPAAKQAIEKARFEEWDTYILLPNDRMLTVAQIVEQLHLAAFLPDLSEGC